MKRSDHEQILRERLLVQRLRWLSLLGVMVIAQLVVAAMYITDREEMGQQIAWLDEQLDQAEHTNVALFDQLEDMNSKRSRLTRYLAAKYRLTPGRAEVMTDTIIWAAEQEGIHSFEHLRVIAAMTRVESNWNPRARSHQDARGILQVVACFDAQCNNGWMNKLDFINKPDDLYDLYHGIRAGVAVYAYYLRHKSCGAGDDKWMAVTCYHGSEFARNHGPRTAAHVQRVRQEYYRI